MTSYLTVGIVTGVVFYVIKLIMFYVGTKPKITRWIRDVFHSGPIGLFILDILAGIVVSQAISSTGAAGITTLFVLVGFSLSSVIYISILMACNKAKNAYHNVRSLI